MKIEDPRTWEERSNTMKGRASAKGGHGILYRDCIMDSRAMMKGGHRFIRRDYVMDSRAMIKGGHRLLYRDDLMDSRDFHMESYIMGPTRFLIWDPCPFALPRSLKHSFPGSKLLEAGAWQKAQKSQEHFVLHHRGR